jgi:hypothetical protein
MAKTIDVTLATYNRLKKFATQGGSPAQTGTIIGNLSEDAIKTYLDHMKQKDPALWKSWGSKYEKPAAEAAYDPDEDLDDVEEEDEPPKPQKVMSTVNGEGKGVNLVPGISTAIPEEFTLRNLDGTSTKLELFSRSPKFGYHLRIPVPSDVRSLQIGSNSFEVDLLPLKRDPDGTTELGGKRYANSKLLAVAEVQDM